MNNMVIVADVVNSKIDRIIKALENTKGYFEASEVIAILEAIKIWDIRINTDHEVYIAFKNQEIIKMNLEKDVIK